jgi:N-acetylglucosaminyldiphosphoundecaprenol N-acetyl-beta-D-mannosaminyltransferase
LTERFSFPELGLSVTASSPENVAKFIVSNVDKTVVAGANLHSIYLIQQDRTFADFYREADLVLVDGFPVYLLCLASRLRRERLPLSPRVRCGSNDWLLALDRMGYGGKVGVVGGTPASCQKAAAELRRRWPSATVEGWDGFEGLRMLRATHYAGLKQLSPDLVLVGLGMPLQETMLREDWDLLPLATYATVGGAIDQVSGEQNLAPRWLGLIGLEWLWRLAHSPRRLWRRYLLEPFLIGRWWMQRKLRGRRS